MSTGLEALQFPTEYILWVFAGDGNGEGWVGGVSSPFQVETTVCNFCLPFSLGKTGF